MSVRPLEIDEFAARIGYRVDGSAYLGANVPYFIRPFRAVRDWRTRRLVIPCSVQSGKTIFMQLCILWRMEQDPRNVLYYAQDDANTLEFSQTRMHPDLKAYLSHRMYPEKAKTKNMHVIFRHGLWLGMMSGENRKNLQSRTAPMVWNDEAALLHGGRLDEAERRGEAYQLQDQFHGVVSTPEDEGTDFHQYWLDSTMEQWSIGCPSCNNVQQLRLPAFRWDDNDVTRPDGEWNFDEVTKTIRVACICGRETYLGDTKAYRRLIDTAHYVETNRGAPKDQVGCAYSGLAVPRRDPAILIRRFIKASDLAKKSGIIGPLKEVIQKDMAEFWKAGEFASEGDIIQTGGYHMGDTDWDEEWVLGPDHRARNLTVDVQKWGFFYVIRMWARAGHSRLLHAGQVATWPEVKQLQEHFGVWPGIGAAGRSRWVPGRVFVDAAWKRSSKPGMKGDHEVYRMCSKYNFFAVQGSPQKETWVVPTPRGSKISRPWSKPETRNAGGGAYCRSFHFGVTTVSSHLVRLMTQQTEHRWETPDDPPEDYFEQLRNKVCNEEGNYEGTNDHYFDCEKMQLPQAYTDGLFQTDAYEE